MIAYDATGSGGTASGTSISFSHTCSGSDRILFVGVSVRGISGRDSLTGVTYNGDALTLVDKSLNTVDADRYTYLYYMIAPDTGAHNVVVSVSETAAITGVSQSYTGAHQSGQPDSFNDNSVNSASSITTSTTTVQDNSWLVSVCTVKNIGLAEAGTGTTRRNTASPVTSMGDSNGAKTPAGSHSMQWVRAEGGENFTVVLASFAPVHDEAETGAAFLLNFV